MSTMHEFDPNYPRLDDTGHITPAHITSGMAWGDRHDRDDWRQAAQAFRTLDGQPVMAERRKYTATDVGRAYTDGVRCGWIGAAAFYAIGTVLLILTFHWLGVH